jgi:Flp pilus assembly pilin Flp
VIHLIQKFGSDDRGAETVEYALVVGLLATAAVVAIANFGATLSIVFTSIATTVSSAV